jgi:hypothetical protein
MTDCSSGSGFEYNSNVVDLVEWKASRVLIENQRESLNRRAHFAYLCFAVGSSDPGFLVNSENCGAIYERLIANQPTLTTGAPFTISNSQAG